MSLKMNLHKAQKILIDEIKYDHRTKRWKKDGYDLKKRCNSILSRRVGYNEPRINWDIKYNKDYSVNIRLYYYRAKEGAKELIFDLSPYKFIRKDKLKKILGK